jgi:hypothetical protein
VSGRRSLLYPKDSDDAAGSNAAAHRRLNAGVDAGA